MKKFYVKVKIAGHDLYLRVKASDFELAADEAYKILACFDEYSSVEIIGRED